MHVHLPKPLHGWREFFHEVAIVVLGILVALALGEAVERARWADQVQAARGAIHREMSFDLAEFTDRLRVAPCIDRNLAEAQRRIDEAAASGTTPASAANMQTPGRLILLGDYQAQQAAQNLVHFPPAELSALGLWYDQVGALKEWNNVEGAAWTTLDLLAAPGAKLGPFDIALLRRDLQVAREIEVLTVINDKRQIRRARDLGVAPGPSRREWVRLMCAAAS
jgi:hypothetical protein